MKSPRKATPFGPASFLLALSLFYGAVVRLRSSAYKQGYLRSRRLKGPVISIGNITVGGTGKTPLVIYLARLLTNSGYKVAVLTRGYKGGAERSGVVVSDGRSILVPAEVAGDEPSMLAGALVQIPVVAGRKRYVSGLRAMQEFAPDVILLDDGFQHLQLARDIDLVLMDSRHPLGNGYLLPRGILRESPQALARAHACVLTRADSGAFCSTEQGLQKKMIVAAACPMFACRHRPYVQRIVKAGMTAFPFEPEPRMSGDTAFLKNRRVVAFSGIADNRQFYRTVTDFGCKVMGFWSFPDHHWYTPKDLDTIREGVCACKAELLLTTAKDHVRLAHIAGWPVDLVVVDIKVDFGVDQVRFDRFIHSRLEHLRSEKETV